MRFQQLYNYLLGPSLPLLQAALVLLSLLGAALAFTNVPDLNFVVNGQEKAVFTEGRGIMMQLHLNVTPYAEEVNLDEVGALSPVYQSILLNTFFIDLQGTDPYLEGVLGTLNTVMKRLRLITKMTELGKTYRSAIGDLFTHASSEER